MIGIGGQLGVNALGAFELGSVEFGQAFVPHRGRARSVLSGSTARSTLTGRRISSTLTATKARSTVGDGS